MRGSATCVTVFAHRGGGDDVVLELNRQALRVLGCERRLAVVPGATHLFAEPGALERVAAFAGDWLGAHAVSVPGGVNGPAVEEMHGPLGTR